MITVIIATIGRITLSNAIDSSLREGFPAIVVGDGIGVPESVQHRYRGQVVFSQTGRKYGFYGSMAFNLAALLCPSEFVMFLGDDDELIPGKGTLVRKRVREESVVDIWVPGLQFDSGKQVLMSEGMWEGNVGSPIMRTEIFTRVPMTIPSPSEWANPDEGLDFRHVREAVNRGYRIKWLGEAVIYVRPRLGRKRGYGSFDRKIF